MQELIDLILHQIRNEPNQQFNIEYDGERWFVKAVNMSQDISLSEAFAKYKAVDTELILALMQVSRKIQMETGE